MSTGEEKKHGDVDITQGKDNVLRGGDIIPGVSSDSGEINQTSLDSANAPKVEPKNGAKSDIPQFDLANDIMAEQRKITAVRRKGPGSKPPAAKEKEPATEKVAPNTKPVQVPAPMAHADKIIADIVRRDIERLCKGLDGR